jgi:hypothetical protein
MLTIIQQEAIGLGHDSALSNEIDNAHNPLV